MLYRIERPDYIGYRRQTTQNVTATMIDCNVAFTMKYANVKELSCTDTRLVFVLEKTMDNILIIRKFIKEMTIKLGAKYGEALYGCVLLHKEGYYRCPFDGFMTVCDDMGIKSIDSFITTKKSLSYDKYIKGCFNYSVKDFYECETATNMSRVDIVDHNKKVRSYPCDNVDNLIDELNTTLRRHLILIVGPPNVGKTTFAERLHGKKMRYIRAVVSNRMVREHVAIYLDEKDCDDDENLIMDGEHANEEERHMFINACKAQNMPCVCVLFDVSKKECLYMCDSLFNQSKGSIIKRPINGITKFYKRYYHPKLSEGIKKIINISGIPQDKIF